MIKGTLGANREARNGTPKIEGYHLYNYKTGFDAFFDRNGRRYRTRMKARGDQRNNIKQNKNLL